MLIRSNEYKSLKNTVNTSLVVILLLLSLLCISTITGRARQVELGNGASTEEKSSIKTGVYVDYFTVGDDDSQDDDGDSEDMFFEDYYIPPEPEEDPLPSINEELEDDSGDDSQYTGGDDDGGEETEGNPDEETEDETDSTPDDEEESSENNEKSNEEQNEDNSEGNEQDTSESVNQNQVTIQIKEEDCYILDQDSDGIFDTFINPNTGIATSLKMIKEDEYFIDDDDDGEWEYIYDHSNSVVRLIDTEMQNTKEAGEQNLLYMLFIVVSLTVAAILIYWLYHDQKKMSIEVK